MTNIDTLRNTLHSLTDLLTWPVMVGLLLAAAVTMFQLGAFVRQAVARRRHRDMNLATLRTALKDGREEVSPAVRLERVLGDAEQQQWRSVSRLRVLVRVGPALGLMGTLIPMAHALQGLADGQLPALAGNMVTAFAATVLGLAISVVAYLLASVQEHWARADGRALALEADRLLANEECS